MTYTPYHSDWKDYPDTSTPITAAALEYIEAGIAANAGSVGPAGSGGASIVEYQLASTCNPGDTSITLDRTPSSPVFEGQYIVVGAYTSDAEIFYITNPPSGAVVTISRAAAYTHSANEFVVVVNDDSFPLSLWGLKGNSVSDCEAVLQHAMTQTALYTQASWLEGRQGTYYVATPLVTNSGRMRNMGIRATSTYAPADTNNAMLMSSQGAVVSFTADASTDIITCTTAHGIPSDGIKVMLKGTNLPGGLVSGRLYYAYNRTTYGFKVSETLGGSIVNITSAGSGGTAYCEINSFERVYLENVTLTGDVTISGLNGGCFALQQPAYTNKLRLDAFTGVALKISGQISNHYNMEINPAADANAVCLDVSGSGHNFFGLNMDGSSLGKGVRISSTLYDSGFFGLWTEDVLKCFSIEASCQGIVISGWQMQLPAGGFGLHNSATFLTDYTISGLRPNATSEVLIHDGPRGYDLYQTDFPNQGLTLFVQPSGLNAPWVPGSTLRQITATTYTPTLTDQIIRCRTGTGNVTITLPTAVGIAGKRYVITHVLQGATSAQTLTVTTTGGETISGAGSWVSTTYYDFLTVVSDGTNWMKF